MNEKVEKHERSKLPLILYFVGMVIFVIAFFIPTEPAATITFIIAIIGTGYHVGAEGIEETIERTKESGKFKPNIHILMILAVFGAILIGEARDGALLTVIFASTHFLEDYAADRSKREIISLMKMNPTTANLVGEDGETKVVQVEDLQVGDTLMVRKGEVIPIDGILLEGVSSVDEATITGESLPINKQAGDEVFGSSINIDSTFMMEVTKLSSDTVFASILKLVETSQNNSSPVATKIEKLEPIYVNTVLIIVPFFILLGPTIFGWNFQESFYRGMVLLTVASPCALAASATPAALSAISNLARNGILFKGGQYVTNFSDIKAIAFDKTGTLTEGKPQVTEYTFEAPELEDVLVTMESESSHPLALAIIRKFPEANRLDMKVVENIGRGLEGTYNNDQYKVGKIDFFKGEERSPEIEENYNKLAEEGNTTILISKNGKVVGVVGFMDLPQKSAKQVIKYFNDQNVDTVMISGDARKTAQTIGGELGIKEIRGNVLPEDKEIKIKELREKMGMTAMLGDGINDAPSLITADIGIAMGEGTGVAMDVADGVLMKNDLKKVVYAHRVSKKLNFIVWENIVFSMAVVVILIILNMFSLVDLPIGVVVHEGSTMIVILNGLRLLVNLRRS